MSTTYTLPAATHLAYAPPASSNFSSSNQVTPRSRTTSLFSTVSSKMRFGATKGKGKGAEGAETTRIKSSFLGRRLSGGTSNRPPPPRASGMPLGELNGAGSGLASYRERAGTYSRSSPELNGAKESAYQPFPVLSIHDDDDEEDGQENDPRLFSSPVAIPAPASRSPRDPRTTYQPPTIPLTRTLSTSPPTSVLTPEEEEARRLASRAEALAKLTEPRQAFPFPASTTAPPRPSRTPPPPPLDLPAPNHTRWSVEREWLVEDPSIRRRKSVNAEKRERHRSAGEAAHASKPMFVPVVQAPSPPSKSSKGGVLRWSSTGSIGELEAGISKEELETDEGFKRGLRRVRSFLRREVGVEGKESEDDETVIRRTLEDGTALCRLINSLHSGSSPILPAEIDTRRSASSRHGNLSLFFEAASTLYEIPPHAQFDSSDLTSPSRSSLLKILRILTLLEHLAYHNPRRSASSLSPTSLPIDINLRGRAVRARNTNTGSSTTSFGHSFESSTGSDGSPNSSRFTDYSFAARKSLEVPPPSTGPSVTFVERAKGSDREKDWGAPAGNVGSNKIYGDRRMSESAIDVLSVVEEDDNAAGTGIHVPKKGGLGRQSTSPSPTPRRPKRFSSDAAPVLWLEGGTGGSPKPRQRHSSDMARPIRLAKRSVSSSAAEQTAKQRDEFGPIKISTELRRRSTDSHRSVTPSENVPFPSTSTSTETTPNSQLNLTPTGPRPRQHKRWNSEVYVERSLVGKEEHGTPARSRHESFQSPSPLKEQGGAGKGKVTRTKLVLREEGRPTLTYQLGECIGRGQFGSVYRALNLNSGRVVAVKRILLEGKSEEEVQQLSNEVSMLKSLDHPSVVKYEGLVRTEHYLNIVLEFIENGSLQKTLKAFGELPEGLVASYVVKILEGLDYLHSMNVVHCDLKAANILTTKNGNIKLSDFGVSLNLNALQNQKSDHDVNGTPNWMAPEVIELKGASTASDIWSLGCTIVELIDGRPPYSEMVAMSAMFRIVEDDRPPIPERCSPELFDFLSQCFAKEPQDRPTANDLFAHEWLQSNWDPRKDLRPQDSIPFLRRISSEMRRPDVTSTFDSPSPLARSASPVDDLFGTSPSSPRGLIFPESGHRDSFDNGSRPNLRESISFAHESDDSPRPHTFVKTTFSKAVDCRLCGEETKRHAVLCRDCGLIAHARCVEFAPSCNLRAQLLSYSTTNLALRSPLARSNSIPTSPVLSPTSPVGFSLGDIIPFGKARRPKITPGSSETSIARTSTDSHASTSTPSRPSNALRHLSDLIGVKSRTPEATPPSSLSKSYTHVANDSFGSSQGSRRGAGSPEQEELGHGPPPPQQTRISLDGGPSNPLSRKLSFAQGTRLKKSHGRSVSQPVNKPPKSSSEDCVVQ